MRKLLLLSTVILVGLAFIARLTYLQIYNAPSSDFSTDNAITKIFNYPKRGYIYDRNNHLLVANQPSYDVMVIPREVEALSPEALAEFCKLLKITSEDYTKSMDKAKRYSTRLPSVFLAHLSKEDFAVLQEKMYKYKGFYIQKRALRDYQTSIGANVLGYIGEANRAVINKSDYYKIGDLIGKEGVEASYEETLRGEKGIQYIQKDRFNKKIGNYKNGIHDTAPIPGKDITITIDSKLQAYGELLMANKRGGIIAIEPSSGEILAMVSAPNYNPNLLVGRERSKNYYKLYSDSIARPLYDRSLLAEYEPGSPFKLVNALIALQENVITPKEKITCYHGLRYGVRSFLGCHCASGSKNNMVRGIQESCNAYFGTVYQRILNKEGSASKGIDTWSKHAKSFGLGNFLNNDLFVGKKGRVPNRTYYQSAYPNKFYATYTISNSIGQGEVATTPIQLANMTAAIANRGFFYTPHIIKSIENEKLSENFTTPKYTTINKEHFEPVIEGMFQVYEKGTAKYLKVPDVEVCGKTGTVENFAIIDNKKTQLTDHSIFVAFAPKDNPKIALAVFVENGYYGNRFAGRIASLMIELYLKRKITREDLENWVFKYTLEPEYAKPLSGKPFLINSQVQLKAVNDSTFLDLKALKKTLFQDNF